MSGNRTEGYVPDPPHEGGLRPAFYALIGDPHQDRHVITRVPVALGLADELNRQPAWWRWAQIDPGSADGTPEHWSHFEGWDVLVAVEMHTWNRREVNDWKGRDEVRKEGTWRLSFNGQVVYGGEVARRDPFDTFDSIRRVAHRLHSIGPIDWRQDDYRGQIEGRRVYYRDQPAVLGHWMPEQGCVMAEAVGCTFRPSAYDIDEQTGTEQNPEHNYSEEWAHAVKIHLDSPDIWWWRRRPFGHEQESEA